MYPTQHNNTLSGHDSAHVQMHLAGQLLEKFGAEWESRGWALEKVDNEWDITGDTGQFYIDSCANDAHAVFALAFLARFSHRIYDQWKLEASYDLIDLDESTSVFLSDMSIEDALERIV